MEPCSWKILWSSAGSMYHFHPVPLVRDYPYDEPELQGRLGSLANCPETRGNYFGNQPIDCANGLTGGY